MGGGDGGEVFVSEMDFSEKGGEKKNPLSGKWEQQIQLTDPHPSEPYRHAPKAPSYAEAAPGAEPEAGAATGKVFHRHFLLLKS